MATVFEVAKWFLHRKSFTHKQLQKLSRSLCSLFALWLDADKKNSQRNFQLLRQNFECFAGGLQYLLEIHGRTT